MGDCGPLGVQGAGCLCWREGLSRAWAWGLGGVSTLCCDPRSSVSPPAALSPRTTPRRAPCARSIVFEQRSAPTASLDSPRLATPVHGDSSPTRTPTTGATSAMASAEGPSGPPLFLPRRSPLLPSSPSPRPPPPTARRKTLAGVTSFTLPRSSRRLKNKSKATPIAVLAEKLLCKRMGIIDEGEMLTENAIIKFAGLFKGQLPDIAIDALRALFHVCWTFQT